tara:strand:+ start:152 stop:349 length:198 start_codon:yes stop_codon:yes gene_type:complete
MKPIDVIRKLVEDNPNDMMLGEVVRQYIRELDESMTCQYSGLPSTKSYKSWPGLDSILNGGGNEK